MISLLENMNYKRKCTKPNTTAPPGKQRVIPLKSRQESPSTLMTC